MILIVVAILSIVLALIVRTQGTRRQQAFEQAVIVNEFEDRDDPYSRLAYVVDPMRDGIYEEQAKATLKARALYHGQSPLVFTCTTCNQQQHCGFAWDFYNVDGDCLMLK